jgi:hypothetical protein
VPPDALADQLLAAELSSVKPDLEDILADLAEIRGRVRGASMRSLSSVRVAMSLSAADFDGRSRREYCPGTRP